MHFSSIYLFSFIILNFVPTILSFGPLSSHFVEWLKSNHYDHYDFSRLDYGINGSFGGKIDEHDQIERTPIIFFHGNSDAALTTNPPMLNGFVEHLTYYTNKGYKLSELYSTSWQDNDMKKAAIRTHDCETIQRLRAFMNAVLGYTQALKISVVSHSMGVTLARKVIKGGRIEEGTTEKTCDIGPSLADRVEVHVAISGGNQGLCTCHGLSESNQYPTCNSKNGFWAGDRCNENTDCKQYPLEEDCTQRDYSLYLKDLNNGEPEGEFVFSLWSKADELVKAGCWSWGQPTCLVPGSHGKMIYDGLSHIETRDLTPIDVYSILTEKRIPIKVKHEL
ncbi:unnamed protein product, partial [Mesorhabditis belari]|uniref:Uncharacterized protein n=1 Tax=Mesorhabditis belari TaxID=2138241 RepID=A0AAF3FKI2_9BILA